MGALSLDDVPKIGLGTWENTEPDQCARSVKTAIEMGYRHVDTAQLYENESAVGHGLREASEPRENIFLATKVSFENMAYDDVIESTRESLRRLGTDYVDLMYVHWPAGEYRPESTLKALRELREQGLIERIGVSNFTVNLMQEAQEYLGETPYANQVEMHPLLHQKHLREDALERNCYLVAYSPFRHGTIFDLPELTDVADKHGATPAQVALAWLIARENVVAVPKATGESHLRENFEALTLELDPEDHRRIDSISREDRYIDPPFAPEWGAGRPSK